mmetsp:Transcript_75007/g.181307  ORF Transcript_75007/g.181307 Transcript_75007/m.181307 type:complete len:200 (+) Transcript_75007:149-748(+)
MGLVCDSRRWRSLTEMNSSCSSAGLFHVHSRAASAFSTSLICLRPSDRPVRPARYSNNCSVLLFKPQSLANRSGIPSSSSTDMASASSVTGGSASSSAFGESKGESNVGRTSPESSMFTLSQSWSGTVLLGERGEEGSAASGRLNFFGDSGPREDALGKRLRATLSPSSSFGTMSRHLRLMHACFFTPGPPNFGLSAQL